MVSSHLISFIIIYIDGYDRRAHVIRGCTLLSSRYQITNWNIITSQLRIILDNVVRASQWRTVKLSITGAFAAENPGRTTPARLASDSGGNSSLLQNPSASITLIAIMARFCAHADRRVSCLRQAIRPGRLSREAPARHGVTQVNCTAMKNAIDQVCDIVRKSAPGIFQLVFSQYDRR